MTDSRILNSSSFWFRLKKSWLWFLFAFIVFYLIGIVGARYQQEHQDWPRHRAEVLATNITWAAHMSDVYELSISLRIHPKNNPSYSASLLQAGPKGALEKRAESTYAVGNFITIRANPENPRQVELDISNSWGAYLIGTLVSLFFALNGLTVFNSYSKES